MMIVLPGSLIRLLLMFGALALAGCATTYSARPVTATVVDAETGEPLEGVSVVAFWALHDSHWRSQGNLELLEGVTDKTGKFYIPGWSDKPVPASMPMGTRLGNADPGIVVFKGGYKVLGLSNLNQPNRLRRENHAWERYSEWDGKVLKLDRFRGDWTFYGLGVTDGVGNGIECHWKRIPRFYTALMRERARLDRLGVRSGLPDIEYIEHSFRNSKCGSAKDFYREYLK
jgi:hypothetical protein